MRKFPSSLLISLCLVAGAGHAAQPGPAMVREIGLPSLAETMQSNGLTLAQAVEQVRRQCNGRIVSAETKVSGNRETHEIKCLTRDGTVRTFRVPGKRRS